MPSAAYLDSMLYLTSLASARFSWGGREYLGEPVLDQGRALELAALELEPEAYGRELFDAVFPSGSELREGLREALLAAEREKSRLRFLLNLSPGLPEWVHALYWELLTDLGRHLALARSPDTAFSRYLGVRQAPGTPTTMRPRLLCIVSAPSGLQRFGLADINRDEVAHRLAAPFGMLAEAADIEVLEPPATLERLRQRLMMGGGFHLLHFFGHGHSSKGISALVLEDEQGRVKFVEEELLAEIFLGVHSLRLVTLIACHGGALSSNDPFSGLAGRLVQRGLPAVIAMRREVSVETAHLFTNHLYTHIAQTGRADAAVNEARQQLYLADPSGIAWSSPVLFSRLIDGRLWLLPEEGALEAQESVTESRGPLLRFSLHRLRHPLPWVPALLALVLFVLGLWPAAKAETRFDLHVSQLFFRLAKSSEVVERLDLEELAATQLASLRLPSSLPMPDPWTQAGEGAMKGFHLATRNSGSHVTLHTPPLPPVTGISIEQQEGTSYRITVTGSDQPLQAAFQGDVRLQPLGVPAVTLHFDNPDALVLVPHGGVAAVDFTLAHIAPDSFSNEIEIDKLSLLRVTDQQTAAVTLLQQESTLLAGEVLMKATGRRTRLPKSESLHFASIAGSLTDLRLAGDGIHLSFQGRVSRLERIPRGLPAENLMPSVLDLWIARPTRLALQAAAGVLAMAILLFTAIDVRPRFRRPLRPAAASSPFQL
ncbi:MAG TPA: CHAT domain-containing protein [Thermoanaerobaculia bacterium]|nr:CHAT domain-containing protein [Thermoanaerobaculia bacterium]